jgi:hypothetical protein
MGDRGQIKIGGVYLYTHWDGGAIEETLRQALLRGQDRWDDEPYLARIIFCEMVKDDIKGTTGYGISSDFQDNEYPMPVVNVDTQTIDIYDVEGEKKLKTISFKDFVSKPRKVRE